MRSSIRRFKMVKHSTGVKKSGPTWNSTTGPKHYVLRTEQKSRFVFLIESVVLSGGSLTVYWREQIFSKNLTVLEFAREKHTFTISRMSEAEKADQVQEKSLEETQDEKQTKGDANKDDESNTEK